MAEQEKTLSAEKLYALENDPDLKSLSDELRKLNIFQVLGVTRTEIRHSNFLAWLLDPNETHGLGDRFLRAWITKLGDDSKAPQDLSDCIVRREWHHIDLLVISQQQKYLLCIENKVFSGEHDEQLSRYREILLQEYPEYAMSFAFLSPDQLRPEKKDDQMYWKPIGYGDVLAAIESAQKGISVPKEAILLLNHYTECVRRYIVGDEAIEKLCQTVYDHHREALDAIFENCHSFSTQSAGVIEEWCKKAHDGESFIYDSSHSNNTYTRFTTPTIRRLLPPFNAALSGWNTTDIAFYEIEHRNDFFRITLTVCSDNMNDQQREACTRLSHVLKRPDKKDDWRWKRLQNWPRHTIDADPETDEYDQELIKALDRDWKEIQKFEAKLNQELQ